MRATVIIALVIAIGCGGSQKKSGGGVASGSGSASGSGAAIASGGGSSAPLDDASPLTRDECATMLGHIVDIAAAEAKGALAPQGDEQVANRKDVIDEQTEACMKQITRAQYACAIAAKSSADLKACPQ